MNRSPEQIIREFLAAWPRKKIDELVGYFTDDAVYHNVPVAPIVGKKAIREVFEGFLGAFDIELIVVNAAARGNVVFTERIDRFDIAGKRFDLPVNGVFELRDGKIASFRDYFDLASFEKPSGLKL